ncbi:MAG: LEA type 2 family protein [Gammaproteobacteria bacterium]|nr:LEA type 2 family protein [Gammaproteobacteria bacterium]NND40003.1 LEA type 2 family protein [Pseudomonadales bacterium]MBT8151349.1 LEA type 2 family protein [Gammaproteobacteria bacterium]NNL11214.1 LEA type 2 family protein [Pseudomonadales bacterium]NNM12249.1 LEA type 2 family protein [Pseudomonadales bacterium]
MQGIALGFKRLAAAFIITTLAACSALQLPLLSPDLQLVHIKPGDSGGLVPSFKVGLLVTNPNPQSLGLNGVSYTINLQGFDVITGSALDIPVVPAQGDALIELDAKLGLIEGAQLLAMMLAKPNRELDFSLEAKLDTGLPWLGIVPVRKQGVIDLQTYTARVQ